MLGRRRRRRPNIKPTLGEHLVFAWQAEPFGVDMFGRWERPGGFVALICMQRGGLPQTCIMSPGLWPQPSQWLHLASATAVTSGNATLEAAYPEL